MIWKVRASPRRARSACDVPVMSSPLRLTVPEDGFSAPVMRLISVVLPAPFGPISARRAPRSKREIDVARDMQRAKAAVEACDLERGHGHDGCSSTEVRLVISR